MELHFDLSGRLTGDMFIAAVLDAFPDYEDAVVEAVDAVSDAFPVDSRLVAICSNQICGHRFVIEPYLQYFGRLLGQPADERESWGSLRHRLQTPALAGAVRRHAMGILLLVAHEYSAGQDASLDGVTFSQTDGWRMVTQAVGAAAIIDGLGGARWTASAPIVPLGSGSNGGIGAAVGRALLGYLGALSHQRSSRVPTTRTILCSGIGFGDRDAYVRLHCFDEAGTANVSRNEERRSVAEQRKGRCS